jgi:hypothetical protein
MRNEGPKTGREYKTDQLEADLVIVGGGIAGVSAAVTAARAGIRVVLIQDRPVLGGNASSEIRLWIQGATSSLANNNRWAREGGFLDELLVENLYRNPEGNPLIFDTVILEKVVVEPNIHLLLNTAAIEVKKSAPDTIESVRAFCSQNSTMYEVKAPLFCDASGDGMVGFLAGAAFRMGAEAGEEFGEKFAPDREYGELLGHSLYFYSKDTGKPVKYIAPDYALKDITKIPRFRSFNSKEYGCQLWWVEYGGRLDTVHDTETIKWELWKVVYGVWDYIKNSGEFPDSDTLTLEWVGYIPGKRESRRFEGPYILTQQDIVEQRTHYDAVSYGGWSIDLHPADGLFSEKPGCNQWHTRGVYQIPYRCLYSSNISNLFLAGRIISATHVAFGSSRVIATCANSAQAVGMAAAICTWDNLLPGQLSEPENIKRLQMELIRRGQYIPGIALEDSQDLTRQATLKASSRLTLSSLPPDGPVLSLAEFGWGQLLPAQPGLFPAVSVWLDVQAATGLKVELRTAARPDGYTPDVLLGELTLELAAGPKQQVTFNFKAEIDQPRYVLLCLRRNEAVQVWTTETRLTGLAALANSNPWSKESQGVQLPPDDIGFDSFEIWTPRRRPVGQNLALSLNPPLDCFKVENITNGFARPTNGSNAWVADPSDPQPTLYLNWEQPRTINRLELSFDNDFDHPIDSVLRGHPANVVPFCVKHYQICAGDGQLLYEERDNHQTRNTVLFDRPITTDRLAIHLLETQGGLPPSLFEARCYSPD